MHERGMTAHCNVIRITQLNALVDQQQKGCHMENNAKVEVCQHTMQIWERKFRGLPGVTISQLWYTAVTSDMATKDVLVQRCRALRRYMQYILSSLVGSCM